MDDITNEAYLESLVRSWMKNNVEIYTKCGEVNITELGEACAEHFNLSSEMGDTPEEQLIFDVASEFFSG